MKKIMNIVEISDENPIKYWGSKIMGDRNAEAIESIKQEGITSESVFYFEIDGKKYVAFYMEGEMKPADMTMQVNKDHQEVMKSIRKEFFVKTDKIYSIDI